MKCNKAETEIVSYLDGELSGKNLAEFERHIQECSHCRAQLEESREFLHRSLTREVPAPSRSLWPAVRHRILKTERDRAPAIPRLAWALAAILTLAFAGWLAFAHFLRVPAAEADTIRKAIAAMKKTSGWEGLRAFSAGLRISDVQAQSLKAASIIPIPAAGSEPIKISFKAVTADEFLQGIFNPDSYTSLRTDTYNGSKCWVLESPEREVWIARKAHTLLRATFRTAVGGELTIQQIAYRREGDSLVPDRFTLVIAGPSGDQGLRVDVQAKDVILLL